MNHGLHGLSRIKSKPCSGEFQIRGFTYAAKPLLCFAVVPVILLAGCHKRNPPPSIDGLTAVLQRTADQTLVAPSLTNDQVILPAMPDHTDAQAGEILHAASVAGGVAIRSVNAQGQISILATIPENNAEAFKAAVRHDKPPPAADASPSSSTRLIEVLIENATASPSP